MLSLNEFLLSAQDESCQIYIDVILLIVLFKSLSVLHFCDSVDCILIIILGSLDFKLKT